jgi:hypothetical protein
MPPSRLSFVSHRRPPLAAPTPDLRRQSVRESTGKGRLPRRESEKRERIVIRR